MSDFAMRRTMMVDTQVRPNDVTKFPVIEAMLAVPMEDFVPASRRAVAYTGENLDLGGGRVLLEPRTLGKMIDMLDLQPDDLVLDLGCGYGYSAAVLARLVQTVVAIEENAEMAAESERRLSEAGVFNVAVLNAPLAQGAPRQAPYDAILINGGVEEVPPAKRHRRIGAHRQRDAGVHHLMPRHADRVGGVGVEGAGMAQEPAQRHLATDRVERRGGQRRRRHVDRPVPRAIHPHPADQLGQLIILRIGIGRARRQPQRLHRTYHRG